MIVVTGAAGFIGSCLVGRLNNEEEENLILVDDFSRDDKIPNLEGKKFKERIDRERFIEWFASNAKKVDFVFHIGARTDTTEFDKSIFDKLNVNYSKDVWKICTEHKIPLVYASSAATYGLGEHGYSDDHSTVEKLKPLNPYGDSKNEFDKWVLKQKTAPPHWYGLKFFNVYGPNEYHKGRMASVIMHAFNQIGANGEMKLFRSHNPDYKDGEQLRDFVYVKDVVEVNLFLMHEKPDSGIYNLGTGEARSFLDLARATFEAMHKKESITFIDTPADIRDKYQYFTEADMSKLIDAGYQVPFYSLEEGIEDYVQQYLEKKNYY
ncbi:MAG TPA: ADP-glyceromanno-heptose 6-epimerase [Bacteroidia bacterium]|nr:ADP-glyceromanno-heptose 6-epimerase [Bacteroidia bacterium]